MPPLPGAPPPTRHGPARGPPGLPSRYWNILPVGFGKWGMSFDWNRAIDFKDLCVASRQPDPQAEAGVCQAVLRHTPLDEAHLPPPHCCYHQWTSQVSIRIKKSVEVLLLHNYDHETSLSSILRHGSDRLLISGSITFIYHNAHQRKPSPPSRLCWSSLPVVMAVPATHLVTINTQHSHSPPGRP